jgi:predicted helicase
VGDDESAFVKVHDNTFLTAKKRLYMTATPRLFNENSKKKAALNDAVLCSMDDETLYGKEIYRLGFGRAVEEGLLTDYKVLVLTLSDKDIPSSVQRMIRNPDESINADDVSKLIGCVNALSKRIFGDEEVLQETDPQPMRRAVAFCRTISVSKEISGYLNEVPRKYVEGLPRDQQDQMITVSSRHIDGGMTATVRDEHLQWLKEDSSECRILTNVRCLSEGVDVPSLDAVLFLSAKDSQVDVVQSVGRVMRLAEGKKYGYIIIPVVVPRDISPEIVLDKTDEFKVVWSVLNALRAHDDRFNATINRLELNKNRPKNILVGGIPHAEAADVQARLQLQFEQLQDTVYARIVIKVGDRHYWENWGRDVAKIAEKQRDRIAHLVRKPEVAEKFGAFVTGIQEIINPNISEAEAIDMLSQHMISKPVFEALFENYAFAIHNPVSVSIQGMIDALEEHAISKETESLEKFYASVRKRVEGIDNAEGQQRVIVELYEKFFKTAFPKMAEQLGIVYTPIEVVDFIVHSVEDVLHKEFMRGLKDEDVYILDPFTGTGTFITRLLQSGLIEPKELMRKYQKEIYANEIVLLAYYIAAVNIENVYHGIIGENLAYESFPGICFTDTFQISEYTEGEQIASEFSQKNSERVKKQKNTPITVIIGNPPYSAGQRAANDNAQNFSYPKLEKRIAKTYVQDSAMTNKNSLYDSYIKAFRWATDRLDGEQGGIIGFVSNGGWIDGNAMDGFRKHLEKEFSSIYVLNLRGNARTSGELRRKERDNVFGQGTRTAVAITLLVKKPAGELENQKAVIFYYDIGDYLSREEKLNKLKKLKSVCNPELKWSVLHPNTAGDWINQRNPVFTTYPPIGDKMGEEADSAWFNPIYSRGLGTSRDTWCYNSSKRCLREKIQETIQYYNSQVDEYTKAKEANPKLDIAEFISYDSTKFSWDLPQKTDLSQSNKYSFEEADIRTSLYRPFFKQHVYFNKQLNNAINQLPKFFPNSNAKNIIICVSSIGDTKEFSTLITDCIPDLHLVGTSQCFPLYYYENTSKTINKKSIDTAQTSLFASTPKDDETRYIRKDGISDFIHDKARAQYTDDTITKEDIFYYVYGFLHSEEYRQIFVSDLKKMLARIPLAPQKEDFFAFSQAGRKLAEIHLHYEEVEPYPAEVRGIEFENFRVTKMKFATKSDKSSIQYNESIVISGIPDKAYTYIVNGKSAIEWVMERYAITIDKDSGIKNDPNDWAEESGNPRYILDLLLRIVTVSVQTMKIVEGLPKVMFGEEDTDRGNTGRSTKKL